MRQRVIIAIALAVNPKLIIADEPTTALDVTIQAQILKLMDKLVKEQGASLILITHDLAVVSQMADRIIVMYCGKIVEICDPRIEKLQREMAENYGFKLRGHVHNLYGICKECRDKAAENY